MDVAPVQYTTTPDGVGIAYRSSGQGVPVVNGRNPTHLGLQPGRPSQAAYFRARCQWVEYDPRGWGLSQRGGELDLSLDALLHDLTAVLDALQLPRAAFVLETHLHAVGVHLAALHPERVSRLVLMDPYVRGSDYYRDTKGGALARLAALDHALWAETLAKASGDPDDEARRLTELLRKGTTPADYARWASAMEAVDLSGALSAVACPVLVIAHDWQARTHHSQRTAAAIPDATFVLRQTHDERESEDRLVSDFLGLTETAAAPVGGASEAPSAASPRNPDSLTARELEILARVSVGDRNAEIAEALIVSPATVTRHVSNILGKTGLSNRAELVRYAMEHGLGRES